MQLTDEENWKEQAKVYVFLCFLRRPTARQNSTCMVFHVQLLGILEGVQSLKTVRVFLC